ncbi:hypothetical protein [Nocardia puris]|uniref:Uncharacterized protein n=1 Tax=Nocardia puris TaxID=208602 RepID=A0A366DMP5_9NOCA|nr:hypothetical protein [Nocardia puris]RBO91360.1 hypothetical protein DFR74_10462 [Nocardia puris]
MTVISMRIFGYELLHLEVTASASARVEPADEIEDGISYSCGHCDELLVTGLAQPLSQTDESDLLAAHVCPAAEPDPVI